MSSARRRIEELIIDESLECQGKGLKNQKIKKNLMTLTSSNSAIDIDLFK